MSQTTSQEHRVLEELLKARGFWVNKQHFARDMWLTQAGRAIHNLEKKHGWESFIEHSTFTDQFGFKSYRLMGRPQGLVCQECKTIIYQFDTIPQNVVGHQKT